MQLIWFIRWEVFKKSIMGMIEVPQGERQLNPNFELIIGDSNFHEEKKHYYLNLINVIENHKAQPPFNGSIFDSKENGYKFQKRIVFNETKKQATWRRYSYTANGVAYLMLCKGKAEEILSSLRSSISLQQADKMADNMVKNSKPVIS
ncbi:hypothetical protein VNO77_29358 [Canavalia gladiata]|uniref:Uncharacterized protein n=1 Tax=Canavalia gladiata TaxID=3824 RepID=A0AAN9KWH4_CANGL